MGSTSTPSAKRRDGSLALIADKGDMLKPDDGAYKVALNIKNQEAHRLAKQLSKLTGENITTTVTQALRERLERIQANSRKKMAKRLMKVANECGARLKEPYRSIDHGEFLYDENGLPK